MQIIPRHVKQTHLKNSCPALHKMKRWIRYGKFENHKFTASLKTYERCITTYFLPIMEQLWTFLTVLLNNHDFAVDHRLLFHFDMICCALEDKLREPKFFSKNEKTKDSLRKRCCGAIMSAQKMANKIKVENSSTTACICPVHVNILIFCPKGTNNEKG